MKKNYLWTKLQARIQLIRSEPDHNYNWLFLPGGPGLGSESLNALTRVLRLPGSIWHLDLPGDGSNLTIDDARCFSYWSDALLEVVGSLENVVLVAHSTGGMYALATKELQTELSGLVLMDSAPDSFWQQVFAEYVKQHPLAEIQELQNIYDKSPNNDALKKLTLASAPILFTAKGLKKGISVLEKLPFNYKSCQWSALNFDQTYKAKWIPQKIPTLILAGNQDHITPLSLFADSKQFQRKNIVMREIMHAGHFPWLENPEQIREVFDEYCQRLNIKRFGYRITG